MADSTLNLRERSCVIAGPLTNLVQNIASTLTQHGADITLISNNCETHQRLARHLNDQREINEKYGRCIAFESPINDVKSCKEAISKAAETFGSIDIYIDTLNFPKSASFRDEKAIEHFDEYINSELRSTFYLSHAVINFLKTRKRGRMLYLVPDEAVNGFQLDSIHSLLRGGLVSFTKSLAREIADISCTVNIVSIGLTEEYLMNHFPETASIKEALEKMRQLQPTAKLMNPDHLANTILYLCSNMGSGTSGELLRVKN
jgi:3-oxoacyl-[acyl-carrier protein] reductase